MIFSRVLTSQPQRFSAVIAGVTHRFRLYFNGSSQRWTVEISDGAGTPLVHGVPLVVNTDVLAQHRHRVPFGLLLYAPDNVEPNMEQLSRTTLYLFT